MRSCSLHEEPVGHLTVWLATTSAGKMMFPSTLKKTALASGLLFFVMLLIRGGLRIPTTGFHFPIVGMSPISRLGGNVPCVLDRLKGNCSDTLPGVTGWEKPKHISKVMGLVFFGRRHTVSILDCYLKRNLVKNGGVLDGVIFVVRTKDAADLAVLDKMKTSEPDYEILQVDLNSKGYSSSYDHIKNDIMYIKIDDDIIFIEDTTIKAIASTKSSRPDLYAVSANVINQILFSWLHRNFGAVKPFLPEITELSTSNESSSLTDWRTSLLPSWRGPPDFQYERWSTEDIARTRWLPIRERSVYALNDTPISRVDYTNDYSHKHWQVAAQEHYSLLENLEKDELWRYRFPMWDFQLRRMGIQFMAMMGKDINLAKPIPPDDEHHFTVEMPTRLRRHAVADGTGVAAHFAYGPQSKNPGLHSTDLLDRYRLFAQKNICKGELLWSPRDDLI